MFYHDIAKAPCFLIVFCLLWIVTQNLLNACLPFSYYYIHYYFYNNVIISFRTHNHATLIVFIQITFLNSLWYCNFLMQTTSRRQRQFCRVFLSHYAPTPILTTTQKIWDLFVSGFQDVCVLLPSRWIKSTLSVRFLTLLITLFDLIDFWFLIIHTGMSLTPRHRRQLFDIKYLQQLRGNKSSPLPVGRWNIFRCWATLNWLNSSW